MAELTLILLPGLDGTGELFKPLIECLPTKLKPTIVSYLKDIPYGYEELLPVVMTSLPKDKDFIILGESFSGPLAILAAHKNPHGLKGIILCASFVKNPFLLLPSWLRIFSVGFLYHSWPLIIKLRALLNSSSNHQQLIKAALVAVKSVRPNVIAKRVKSILSVNVERELRECKVPVLYIAGSRDNLIKNYNAKRICFLKQDVNIVEINTSHFVLQLAPCEAAITIQNFANNLK